MSAQGTKYNTQSVHSKKNHNKESNEFHTTLAESNNSTNGILWHHFKLNKTI